AAPGPRGGRGGRGGRPRPRRRRHHAGSGRRSPPRTGTVARDRLGRGEDGDLELSSHEVSSCAPSADTSSSTAATTSGSSQSRLCRANGAATCSSDGPGVTIPPLARRRSYVQRPYDVRSFSLDDGQLATVRVE